MLRKRMSDSSLGSLLARSRPTLLDGAVGTELSRRGVRTTLPLWSAHALLDDEGLRTLTRIHEEYARSGAEILVTNTFRTTPRILRKAGLGDRWKELNQKAVGAARAAAGAAPGRPPLVAGGIAPLEDCYRPDLVPPQETCLSEHRRQVRCLVDLGVDLILIETMNSAREARSALEAARDCGIDVLLSLCPEAPDRLLSGESLREVVPQLLAAGGPAPRAVLLNCASPEVLDEVYPRFSRLVSDRPHGLYAHLGEPDDVVGWRLPERHDPQGYADWMARRLEDGTRLVGGCCGTTPEHIAALSRMLDRRHV
jgi:S-methylmethionine-dependent homocysteine/selenocysteine methylase